jgi:hypothetical protein
MPTVNKQSLFKSNVDLAGPSQGSMWPAVQPHQHFQEVLPGAFCLETVQCQPLSGQESLKLGLWPAIPQSLKKCSSAKHHAKNFVRKLISNALGGRDYCHLSLSGRRVSGTEAHGDTADEWQP